METNKLRSYTNRLKTELTPGELPAVTAAMAAIATLAWVAMFDGWLPMPMPETGPMSAPGIPEAIGTSNGLGGVVAYLLMFGVMMIAMMYPAMVPFVRRYADAVEGSTVDVATAAGGFLAAYSLVWTAVGVVPLALDALVDVHGLLASHGAFALGGTLVAAGLYQFSDYKQRTLADCCGDVGSVTGALGPALRDGIDHGIECVRCTGFLMALLVVLGTMNAFMMLLVTFVVTLERHAGSEVATSVGLLATASGLVVWLFGVSPL